MSLDLDKDREDIEVTSIGYVPMTSHTHLPTQRTLAGSIPLSADKVRYSPTDGAPKIIIEKKPHEVWGEQQRSSIPRVAMAIGGHAG